MPKASLLTAFSPPVLAGAGTVIFTVQDGWFAYLYGALTLGGAVNSYRALRRGTSPVEGAAAERPRGLGALVSELVHSESLLPFAQGFVNLAVAASSASHGDPKRAGIFLAMTVGTFTVAAICHNPSMQRIKTSVEKFLAEEWHKLPEKMQAVIATPGVSYGLANVGSTFVYTDIHRMLSSGLGSKVFEAGVALMAAGALLGLSPLFSNRTTPDTLSTKISGIGQFLAGISSGLVLGYSPAAAANCLWGLSVSIAGFREDKKNREKRKEMPVDS